MPGFVIPRGENFHTFLFVSVCLLLTQSVFDVFARPRAIFAIRKRGNEAVAKQLDFFINAALCKNRRCNRKLIYLIKSRVRSHSRQAYTATSGTKVNHTCGLFYFHKYICGTCQERFIKFTWRSFEEKCFYLCRCILSTLT